MAVKISQLITSSAVTSGDFVPIVDLETTTTKRASASQILDYITGSNINKLQITSLTGSSVSGTSAQFSSITGTIVASAGNLASTSYMFIGDPNTGFYSPAADTIGFVEGGTEVIRITSTSNVGIGTISPNFKLSVTGTLGVSGATTLTTISGTTAQFTTITASNELITNNLTINGTASISKLIASNPIRTVSGAETLNLNDSFILASGISPYTINLFSAVGQDGKLLSIKRIGTATVIIDGFGAELIEGSTTFSLGTLNQNVRIIASGSNWYIV